MASCRLFKKATLPVPLPSAPDPAANPGEFGFIDHEDGTFTIVILDPAGNPSPIDSNAASMTVASDHPEIVKVDKTQGFTCGEFAVQSVPSQAASTSKAATHIPGKGATKASASPPSHSPTQPKPSAPGSGAVATITATITWAGGNPSPHTLTWKDTITVGTDGVATFKRGEIAVV